MLEVDTGSLYTLFLTTEQTDSPDRDSLLRRSHHEVTSQAGQVSAQLYRNTKLQHQSWASPNCCPNLFTMRSQ